MSCARSNNTRTTPRIDEVNFMSIDPAMLAHVRSAPAYRAPSVFESPRRIQPYAVVPQWKRIVKRGFDVVFSCVALSLFAALLPFIALAIKLDSRGPVFYRQDRVGINRRDFDRRSRRDFDEVDLGERRCVRRSRDRRKVVSPGRQFSIIKLRTMVTDAEADGVRWAHRGDSRITRVGHFLRLSRLDEVPQFWNVLIGDMSVVGPRPERPPFIELLSNEVPGYLDRLRFKPGITGLSQVELGYDSDVESVHRKVETDVRYITEFSLFRDLVILFRTVAVVVTGRGAA